MTPNETDTQVDAPNEVSTTTTPLEEISSNPNKDIDGGSIPSNVLDRPIESLEDDLIGTKDLQDGLIEYIKRANKPFTIAIQGEWGLGKTSFLNLLKARLCGNNQKEDLGQNQEKYDTQENNAYPYYSVWIDVCKFTLLNSPIDAVIYIMQSMVYQISHFNTETEQTAEGNKYIERGSIIIKNLGKFIAKKAMIQGATVLTGGFLTDKTIETVTNLVCDPLFQNNEQQADNISVVDQLNTEIKNLMKDVLENYNPQKKEGIIFFIDNLDRIDPKLAVEILETTNNVFSFKDSKCVFIISIDNNILLRGLQPKLGNLTKDNIHIFQAYLDKFVQLSISLELKDTTISNLLISLLKDIGFFDDKELGIVIDGETEGSLETLGHRLVNFTLLFATCNPRSIKRLVNTLSLILSIIKVRNNNNGDINDDMDYTIVKILIFIITCIQNFSPKLFNKIFDQSIYTHTTGTRFCTVFSSRVEHVLRSIDDKDTLYNSAQKLLNILNILKTLKYSKAPTPILFDEILTKAINMVTFLYIKPPFSD